MTNTANYQGLAMRIKKQKSDVRAIEFAEVVAIKPHLIIEIDGQKYSAEDWEMYEALHEYKEIKTEKIVETTYQDTKGELKYIEAEKLTKMKTDYKIGDQLAVQQINDVLFIILCKLRRVE